MTVVASEELHKVWQHSMIISIFEQIDQIESRLVHVTFTYCVTDMSFTNQSRLHSYSDVYVYTFYEQYTPILLYLCNTASVTETIAPTVGPEL